MRTPVPQRVQSIGRALQSTSRGTHHTFSSSTRTRSRCDMLAPGGCARLSALKTYSVPGMGTGHRLHHSHLTSMEPGTKLQCQGYMCTGSCAQTTQTDRKDVLIHLAPQLAWNSMSLRSHRLSARSLKSLRHRRSIDSPCLQVWTARDESRIRLLSLLSIS